MEGEHHQLAVEDLGIRAVQERVPLLIGGHGRRVVGIAARHADIFQFTGLTHGEGGEPSTGGFGMEAVRQRARWLADAAGDAGGRLDEIECSSLVQFLYIGDDADEQIDSTAERFELSREIIIETPFVLIGSLEQVVDKIERLRADVGISHHVIRDAEGFAPVAAALSGR
jgi:alkanesulfonate monooxygenase SsuD/methylene tetrahydromethanopterin reductase-like flavin-dependent oxidoreductase (luciferase family)